MPQHKSCKKRIKTSKKQNVYNRAIKSRLHTTTKKFLSAEGDDAEKCYREVSSELDLAARKGVIPKQRADRRKGRLAKVLSKKTA